MNILKDEITKTFLGHVACENDFEAMNILKSSEQWNALYWPRFHSNFEHSLEKKVRASIKWFFCLDSGKGLNFFLSIIGKASRK